MRVNKKDLGAALVFALIAGFFAIDSVRTLRIGSTLQMGPGYFPLALSIVLFAIVVVILIRAFRVEDVSFGTWPWRAIFLIILGPILFSVSIRGLGLVPSAFLVALITSFASRRMTPLFAIVLAASISLFCWAVFVWGIGLPMPVFGHLFH